MRPSQTQRLLDIEQRRTSWRYDAHARAWQLKWATAVALTLYILARYHLWRNPRPQRHVWIDDVLVEVLEDGWVEKLSLFLFYSLLFFGSLLLAFLLCVRPGHKGHRAARHRNTAHATGTDADHGGERFDNSTIRPVRRDTASPTDRDDRSGVGGRPSAAAARPARLDPTKPMRTSADLESFLQRASLEQQRQRGSAGALNAVGKGEAGFFTGQPLPHRSFLGPAEGQLSAGGTIHVRYNQRGGRGGGTGGQSADGAPRGLSARDWESLGVHNLDHGLARTREWVSGLCRALVAEVEECDRWFAANEADAYDCSHSLREVLQVAAAPAVPAPAPVMGGWGSGGMMGALPQQQKPQVQTITKQQALVEQRGLVQRSDHRNFDTILRLDQRVALEVKLDVTGTFPESGRLSNAELCARQQYVLQRLRTFAKQRTLAAYKHSGGDGDAWREGFPCDAHLLLHVVRTGVEGMSSYVRFGYQGGGDKAHDLAVYVGDTGEPYFYVRYRSPAQDRLYATRPGPLSLFEALLVFAAVIHVNHSDVYGGIRGTMDLQKAGLTSVLWQPKLGAAWTETV